MKKQRQPRPEFQPGAGPMWTTEEGASLYINQMPSPHLLNAMKLLDRKAGEIRSAIIGELSMAGQGESKFGATAESQITDDAIEELKAMSDFTFLLALPAYRALYAEARRRKLGILLPGVNATQGWETPKLPPDPLAPSTRRKQHRRLSRLRMEIEGFGRKTLWSALYPRTEPHQPLALIRDAPDDGKVPW